MQDQFGHTQRCQGTSCDITGLENRTTYKFRVRAHNPVGFSEWSGWSGGMMPDKPIDLNGRIKLVEAGDGILTIDWKRVEPKGGGEASTSSGAPAATQTSTRPRRHSPGWTTT